MFRRKDRMVTCVEAHEFNLDYWCEIEGNTKRWQGVGELVMCLESKETSVGIQNFLEA